MVEVKVSITVEGEEVKAIKKDTQGTLEFAEASLPSGASVKAEAIDVGMGVVVLNIRTSGLLTPGDVKVLNKYVKNRVRALIQQLGTPKVLVLSGRLPIWAYVSLVHEIMHTVPAVGIFDPKLQGAVIVVTHNPGFQEGEMLRVPNEIVSKLLA